MCGGAGAKLGEGEVTVFQVHKMLKHLVNRFILQLTPTLQGSEKWEWLGAIRWEGLIPP